MMGHAASTLLPRLAAASPASRPAGQDARFRTFREGPFVANFLRQAPMERFWLSDLRRFCLFLYMLRESDWMRDGQAGRVPFALAATRSQLSLARLSQLLEMAHATGDFERRRDPRDARQYVFEPSARAFDLLDRLVEDFHEAAPALIGRRAPVTMARGRAAQRRFIEGMLQFLGGLDLGNRGVGSLSFMLAMLDLHLHSPLATTDLIRREADRLHVTPVTIRNLLRRAEQRDMLRRDRRMLSLSEQGLRRVRVGMDAFEALVAQVLLPEAMPGRTAEWRRSGRPSHVPASIA
ncbi:hypothetical protein [Roseomonas sp. HF4]|uniref:hypothetical protein n=1 Tax=Roseomonas sp. HF4 TaxID=2562313 RepID=UPI0014851F2E|nr:hypothetical protein [Roseomonas sp. HF4]